MITIFPVTVIVGLICIILWFLRTQDDWWADFWKNSAKASAIAAVFFGSVGMAKLATNM